MSERTRVSVACVATVKRIVSRIRPPDNCKDDCIQAGHLAVLRAYDRWDQKTIPYDAFIASWVKPSIVREVYREIERNQPRDDMPVHEISQYEDSDLVPDETLIVDDEEALRQRNDVIEFIIDLRDKTARNLMLLVLEGHSVSEAGRLLGISQSTADRLYQRTVVLLKEKLA